VPDLELAGCPTTPLAGYLTALGLLRAVSRTLDEYATGRWERQRFIVTCSASSVPDLVDAMCAGFVPEPIVSPWNAGSGFAGNGKNTTAEDGLRWVRESQDPRLAPLRAAVTVADEVVRSGRARGWGGKGEELWDKAFKARVFAVCRERLPDAALPWLDAAVALGPDGDATFSRLLGTGANFGRQDLSATYVARIRTVWTDKRSRAWLLGLLTGDETVPYLRDAVGQFDPGRAGGIQSSPWEKRDDKGFVNPWAFLLTMEGTLLFASAMVRRHGAEHAHAALPFQVSGTTGAHNTSAMGEQALAEIFAPEWSDPMRLEELEHLLGEGRADWRQRPARTPLDFVRAIASLGVDRGIVAFQRHVIAERLGQNPLAIPTDRITVTERGTVRLLGRVDPWLDSLHRITLPGQVSARVRGVEQALYQHATTGADTELVEVFAALGRAHEAVSRSAVVRPRVAPLTLDNGVVLARVLASPAEHDRELRIALALATAHDAVDGSARTLTGLRPLLSPVGADTRRRVVWTERPILAPLTAGLLPALAEAARRRAFPGAVADTVNEETPGMRGVRIAFTHGLLIRAADLRALIRGSVDHQRISALLAGLLTVDWQRLDSYRMAGDPAPDPTLDLLLPFAAPRGVAIHTEGTSRTLLVRPGSDWPTKLAAGNTADVLADAARRLRIGGLRFVVSPRPGHADPAGLAAALLFTASRVDINAALHRVAVLPDPRTNEEITA
jgi:CRISPR-associated protein Csx17